jgi:SAM-dependent methyltransferase
MRVLAFLYPGAESWNHFQPVARLLRQLGHDLVIADFGLHVPSPEDKPLNPPPVRIALTDVWEGHMGRMDRQAYIARYGDDVDFAASTLFYHTMEGFPLKRGWLYLDAPFYQRLYGLAHRVHQVVEAVRPGLAICAHGINPLPAVTVAKCRALGIPVTLFESPFFPGRFSLDADGVHFLPGINRIDRMWPQVRDRALTPEQSTALNQTVAAWRSRNESKYAQDESADELARLDAFARTARKQGRRLVFLPEQIPWDANVLVGLDGFHSWSDFVRHVLTTLPPEYQLVYKRHPRRRERDSDVKDSERVLIVGDVSIHSLFQRVEGVCAFSSNVGFEALLCGLPVACGGRPHYGDRGFTTRLTRETNGPELSPLTGAQQELLGRFAHHILFDFLISFDDAEGLARRIGEATTDRGQLQPARRPFAAAFPAFAEDYLELIARYNRPPVANGTHFELLDGAGNQCSGALESRISPGQDVDEDGLVGEREYVGCLEDASARSLARYRLAAKILARCSPVLDMGCGSGFGTRILADNGATSIVGVEPSVSLLDFARNRWPHPLVDWRCQSAASFFRSETNRYGGVACFGVMELVPDDRVLLFDLWKLLAPAGILVVSFVNAATGRLEPPHHVRYRHLREIRQMLGECEGIGFSDILGEREDGSVQRSVVTPSFIVVAQKQCPPGVYSVFPERLQWVLESENAALS